MREYVTTLLFSAPDTSAFHPTMHRITAEKYKTQLCDGISYFDKIVTAPDTELYLLIGFDFTTTDQSNSVSPDILPHAISAQKIIFRDAVFTFEQVKNMLLHGVDLSKSTYRLNAPVTPAQYDELYYPMLNSRLLACLHGITVDFSDYDLRRCRTDYVTACNIYSLKNTTISETQLFFLLREKRCPVSKKALPLNLSSYAFEEMNLEHLFDCASRLTFDLTAFNHLDEAICLHRTSIRNAIIPIELFEHLAKNREFHHWFDENDLSVYIAIESSGEKKNVSIFVDAILKIKRESGPRTPRFISHIKNSSTYLEHTRNEIIYAHPEFQWPEVNTLTKGGNFLWLMYAAQTYRDISALNTIRSIFDARSVATTTL
jgi:hypothetical protein